MKYFRIFNTSQEYYTYETSEEFIVPNVSTLRDSSQTWITKLNYFTLRSLADNNTFTIKNNGTAFNRYFSYSLDKGKTWTDFTLESDTTETIATINSGDTIMMKGNNERLGTNYNKGCIFRGSKNYEVEGSVSSLLNGNDTNTELSSGNTYHFAQLFSGDTNIISAEKLLIPSTKVYQGSYNGMFRACKNLLKAPKVLPATVMANDCYSSMFEECTSLIEPPIISATTMATACMSKMFCMHRTSKVTAAMTKGPTIIAADVSASNCLQQLCCGNGSLTEITLYATTIGGTSDWLKNVSDSGIVYKKQNTILPSSTSGVPNGWTTVDIIE